ncbi:hypothetical protein PF005_g29394 [Phytophthora fragariae]|nr:hypothetical protein PF010_g29011 [Phytophthora fragariae]KAE9073305.1 hypothetical protein PF006_g28766 [Phytophthora fragariae]KAE9165958.1 hypothetical protein PF005_g29394 [Phytophthora fragariae]KAE9169147.1 hypothetical protein PF004_g28281 [Phytophthora fragariae]KAE9174222.1 hypothetical protein PF002_g29111 [Phytophthora fragariae]
MNAAKTAIETTIETAIKTAIKSVFTNTAKIPAKTAATIPAKNVFTNAATIAAWPPHHTVAPALRLNSRRTAAATPQFQSLRRPLKSFVRRGLQLLVT